MKKIICLLLVLNNLIETKAQSGCTDPTANNYNSSAATNDGSCTYNVTNAKAILRATLSSSLSSSSGVQYADGNLWTFNDSGNPPYLFKIDSTSGAIVQTVEIINYPNVDWEDMTADSNYIYVSDAGKDNGTRTDLKILKISKSDITSATTLGVNAQAISFSYTDQTSFTSNSNTNYDCESIISIDTSLYLFSKDRGDLKTRVYRVSKTPGTYALTPITSYNVNGKITGADYNPITKEVVLIGYMSKDYSSFLWFLNDFTGDQFFSGNKRRIEIGTTSAWQTEGVTYRTTGHLFITNETNGINASLYTFDKSTFLPAGIQEYSSANNISVFPNPASESLTIKGIEQMRTIEVWNMLGENIFSKAVNDNAFTLALNEFTYSSGVHFIRVTTAENVYSLKVTLTK